MRDLCRQHKKDYYDRLCYIAADRSERMLQDVLRHGVLAEHPGRYCVRQLDALRPEELFAVGQDFHPGTPFSRMEILPHDGGGRMEILPHGGRLRAVFLNYLLDCLPAAVLAFDGDAVRQLCVRTCLARNVRLADYTDLTPQQLRERAKSADPRVREELLEVYGLFASEYDYQPIPAPPLGLPVLPYSEFALSFGPRISKRLLHSYGAIQCLEKLLGMLADGGFILVNDYGQTLTPREDEFEHQRFSLATFVGINFPELRAYFGDGQRCQYYEPAEEGRGIHSRLLGVSWMPTCAGSFSTASARWSFSACRGRSRRRGRAARRGGSNWRRGFIARRWRCSRGTGCCCARSASS